MEEAVKTVQGKLAEVAAIEAPCERSPLEEIKADIKEGKRPKTTVREFLRWFGVRRRRTSAVGRIKAKLAEAGVMTVPDFTKVWIDSEIHFEKIPLKSEETLRENDTENIEDAIVSESTKSDKETKDAIFLISMLGAANRGVASVKPQDSIEKAITLMLANDYSQLPVMTSERDLRGAVSWKTIGKRLSHKNEIREVKDAMESVSSLNDIEPLFKATKAIIDDEFVFVRSSHDRRITGIVTATDLSEQFQFLSEPFLLIGQIENQIRSLLNGVFDEDVLKEACNGNDPDRLEKIAGIEDLTFGEYIRILENPERWEKLGLLVDRAVFCEEMNKVRLIRNDVMHFDPDGIDEDQYNQLRRFSNLLDELEQLSG